MKIYRLTNNKTGKVIYEGSLAECKKREKDSLEYVGVTTPIYRATNNNGLDETGTMSELTEKLDIPLLTLYNYTRYTRRNDGLFVEKVGEHVVQKETKD